MLVKINPTLGSNTDPRNRIYNIMRAVKAVATANAGTTPTCNVISGPTGTFEANQMITVIDNTEAGGWSVDASNTACGNIGDSYNSSLSNTYLLNLYSDSGKATYPYKVFGLRTNPNYPFGSNFTYYPVMTAYYGCSNTTVWGKDSYANGSYISGNSATTVMLYDPNGQWSQFSNTQLGSPSQSTSYYTTPLHYSHGEFYMAATSDYLIFSQANSYLMYCGVRETQGWEDSFSDNPPVVGFFYQRLNHPQTIMGFTKFLTTSNTTPTASNLAHMKIITFGDSPSSWTNNSYHPYHIITGEFRSTSVSYYYNTRSAVRMNAQYYSDIGQNWPAPLFYGMSHSDWHRQNSYLQGNWSQLGAVYAPVYDSATQTLVPPAIPIVYSYYGTRFNPGGRIKGLLKSLGGNLGYINQYASTDQDFNITINGNTEPYRTIFVAGTTYGPNTQYGMTDMFLIRKK